MFDARLLFENGGHRLSPPPACRAAHVSPQGGLAHDPLSPQPCARATFGGYLRASCSEPQRAFWCPSLWDAPGIPCPFPRTTHESTVTLTWGPSEVPNRTAPSRGAVEVALGSRTRGYPERPRTLVPGLGGRGRASSRCPRSGSASCACALEPLLPWTIGHGGA
eukprot:1523457-Prymnesium_polylepis.1